LKKSKTIIRKYEEEVKVKESKKEYFSYLDKVKKERKLKENK
jgi:hypothetical protein